jgi:hypothetical protein
LLIKINYSFYFIYITISKPGFHFFLFFKEKENKIKIEGVPLIENRKKEKRRKKI